MPPPEGMPASRPPSCSTVQELFFSMSPVTRSRTESTPEAPKTSEDVIIISSDEEESHDKHKTRMSLKRSAVEDVSRPCQDSDLEYEIDALLARQYLTVEECLQVGPATKELLSGPIGPSEFNTLEELEACICLEGNLPTGTREHIDAKEVNPPMPTTPDINRHSRLSAPKSAAKATKPPRRALPQITPAELQQRWLLAYASLHARNHTSPVDENFRGRIEATRRRLVVPVINEPKRNMDNFVLCPDYAQKEQGPPQSSWPYADRDFAHLHSTGPSPDARPTQIMAHSPASSTSSLPTPPPPVYQHRDIQAPAYNPQRQPADPRKRRHTDETGDESFVKKRKQHRGKAVTKS